MYQTTQTDPLMRQRWAGVMSPQPEAEAARTLWRGTLLHTTPEGREESFAIGPDGFVWSYGTGNGAGESAQGAGRLIGTGLPAQVFSVGQSGNGPLVVLGGDGACLRHVHEAGTGARWSAPRDVVLPIAAAGVQIERILSQDWGMELHFAVLLRMTDVTGRVSAFLWDALWTGETLAFAPAPVEWDSGNAFWLHRLANEGVVLS